MAKGPIKTGGRPQPPPHPPIAAPSPTPVRPGPPVATFSPAPAPHPEVERLTSEVAHLKDRHEAINRDLRAKDDELKKAISARKAATDEADEARKAKAEAESDRRKAEALADSDRRKAEEQRDLYEEKLRALNQEVDAWVRNERARRLDAVLEEEKQLRKQAQTYVDGLQAAAEQDRNDARGEAEAAAAAAQKTRDEARRAADKAREAAQKEAAELKDEAARVAAELRKQAVLDAGKSRETAELAAVKALGLAQEQAGQVKREAEVAAARLQVQSRDTLARAEAEAGTATERRNDELDTFEEQLNEQAAELEGRETDLQRREKLLVQRGQQLNVVEEDLQGERDRLKVERQMLAADVQRLGPRTVERLERQIAELEQRLAASHEAHEDAARRADKLREELAAMGGADAGIRLAELSQLRNQVELLRTRLAESLPTDEIEHLRAQVGQAQRLKDEAADLRQRLRELEPAQEQADKVVQDARRETRRVEESKRRVEADLEQVRRDLHAREVEVDQLEIAAKDAISWKIQLEAEEVLRASLERKLEAFTKAAQKSGAVHYGRLAELTDDLKAELPPASAAPPLAHLAMAIRQRIASDPKQPLFYDDHTIRAFLGSMACADLTLLQGPSGTGKTSLPIAVGRAIGASVVRVPVQAGWRDRADLVGDYNAFTERFRCTEFTAALYQAQLDDFRDRPVFVVLDECNLSQMEYYFADFLSGLEDWSKEPELRLFDERPPTEVAPDRLRGGTVLPLTRNVRYFGTANQDETTFGIADKTYDRASVLLLEDRAKSFQIKRLPTLAPLSWSSLLVRFEESIKAPDYEPSAIKKFVEALEPLYMREFGFGLGNRFLDRIVGRFLPVYVAAGGTASDGLDHLVRTRIVRRLDRSRDPALKKGIVQLDDLLDKQWPFKGDKGEAVMSRVALSRVLDRVGT